LLKIDNSNNEKILQIIKKTAPETVEELITIIEEQLQITRKEALNHINELENNGLLKFTVNPKTIPLDLKEYLLTENASWFWIIAIISIITILSILLIPERFIYLNIIRYISGSIFVLYLPGYSFIKAVFPFKEIDGIERTTLSLATSLGIVPITVLALNFTPFGIRLAPITVTLFILIISLSFLGIMREHQKQIHTRPYLK
jgi:DNA-binding Lrp family transcriptional regulator